MQSFLILCAICLRLNDLSNQDLQVIQQKEAACNQCLSSLNKPVGLESPIISETFSCEQAQKDIQLNSNCGGEPEGTFKLQAEYIPDQFKRTTKSTTKYSNEITALLEDKKTSLASIIHNKIEDLSLMIRYRRSELPNLYKLVLDLLKKEEAKLVKTYSAMLDEASQALTNKLDLSQIDEEAMNELAIMMWQFSSKIDRLLLSKRLDTLKQHLEALTTNSNETFENLRILIEEKEIPTEFKNTLKVYEVLTPSKFLTSQNGIYEAVMQLDGNFVVYDLLYRPLWHASTYDHGKKIAMRPTGNLVIYNGNKEVIWSTETENPSGAYGHYVKLENDGRLVMYDDQGHVKKEITL